MSWNRQCFFRQAMRERERDIAGGRIRAREKAANPIPRSSPTVVMAEGGEKTQPRPGRKASEVGLQAFLRLIKDIRGRLARYFSSPSVNRGAQPPPSIIPQKVDEGIFVLWPPRNTPAVQSSVTVLVVNCSASISVVFAYCVLLCRILQFLAMVN